MSIWYKKPNQVEWDERKKHTFTDYIGVKTIEFHDDSISGKLIVDERNMQGFGMLHGGVAIAFADSLVGFGANCTVDYTKFMIVTIDMNISYIRPGWPGVLTGVAKPLHMGKSTQVWSAEIRNEEEKLQTVSRFTMGVIPHRSKKENK